MKNKTRIDNKGYALATVISWNFANRNESIRNTRLLKTALITLMLGLLTGCTTFKLDDPSPFGTFYPNQPIRHVSFTKNDFWNSNNVISFSKPAEIKAVGKMTWNSLIGNYYETALISPKLDHLSGDYWISTDGDYYATISWLQANGRIEYTGYKTSASYFWGSGWGSLSKILILIISIYLGYLIIKFFIKSNERKRLQIVMFEFEEKERRTREDQEKKEREIERRKKIVIDIVNNLYKNTEKEVNKTLIPTLINELYDIYTGLHSDNLNELIINGSLTDFQNIINLIKSELARLKKLALDAQARGYTDEERESAYSEDSNGKMTKEKAFEIFGLKQTATKEETKRAYRDLVKKYNTDQRTNLEDHIKQMLEEKMKELNNAKDYLSNLGLL
jgi:DnaJ-domain-containing protein 1